MNYTKQQLLEKYKKLPQAVQEAMGSEANADIVLGIGAANKLEDAQTQKITETIAYVMLGVLEAEDFVSTLKSELKVDDAVVEKIATEVSQKIFLPIREAMQSVVQDTPAQTEPVSVPQNVAPVPLMKKPDPVIEASAPTAPMDLPGATPVIEESTTDEPEESLSREEVLRGIEDAPTAPVASEETKLPEPVMKESVPAKSFIEEKLSAPTASAKETVQTSVPESYSADPYREPVA